MEHAIAQRDNIAIATFHKGQELYLSRLRQTYGRQAVDAAWALLKKAKAKSKGKGP